MYKFLSKNGQLLSFVVGIVISLIFVVSILTGIGDRVMNADMFKDGGGVVMSTSEIKDVLDSVSIFDFGFYSTYVLLTVAVAAAILLSLWFFVTNFSVKALRNLIPIIIMLVIFFIVYSSYSADTDAYLVKVARDAFSVGDNESKLVSAGITTALWSLVATVAVAVVVEIVNFFR